MSDVFYMKLTNGEDIICKIEKEDNENQMYFISNPLKVSYNFVPENNRMSMGLSYWIPLAESSVVTVYFDHVIAMSKLQDEMNKFYFSSIEESDDEIINDGEEDKVLEEYLNEVNSDISKKLISANTVH